MGMYFGFFAGLLAGVAAVIVALPLIRGAGVLLQWRAVTLSLTGLGIVAFGVLALVLYHALGSPDLISRPAAQVAQAHPGIPSSASSANAESMESVVARLEARVARDGGRREDWLLLAQSYEFLGRSADAQRAREHAEAPNAAASPAAAMPTQAIAQISNPRAEGLRAAIAAARREHDAAKARDGFVQLVKMNAMDADLWADYADVLASSSSGSLRGEPAKAIDEALRLNPLHPKALWLKASLAHEEHRYVDALALWRQLRAALPPGSPDVRVVEANIAEAAELAGVPASPAPTAARAAAPADPQVTGTVSVDSKLASRVPAGATLFIYAKAVDSPGPPLAVLRQVADAWPVTFTLDDSLAMIPTRRLSQFDRVIVEARISRSGQATPMTGDLYGRSAVLKPGERKKLVLVIGNEVG
jgi:cytochrome c-type biogenesis protein CcmH/NrfG